MRESQKVERLWLTFPSSFPVLFGEPPELDPARLVWMEFQPKLPQPFPEILQEAICFRLVLSSVPTGITEVSRFSCTKLLGVSGVYDYAGPAEDSR